MFMSPEGHKYSGRKLTKTYVIEFAIESLYLFSYKDCSDCEMSKSLTLQHSPPPF